MRVRRLSLLTAIIIMLSLLPALTIPAQAAYENTYKNTGNQRDDIIGVALTQVGYLEGNGNNNNNDTKYGDYFGRPKTAWCGWFVSWCARQAGIPKSVIKSSGPATPSSFGIKKTYKSGYTPLPGDLFFKGDDHVGIVYYTDGKYFYTIEGNTWTKNGEPHGVYIRKRVIADYTFGVPSYTDNSGSTNCDHNYEIKHEVSHPHKEYKQCTKCSTKTSTGNNVYVSDCKSCIQESCSHAFTEWDKSSSTKHKRICALCEKSETASHKWSAAETVKQATCSEKGTKKQTCTDCNAEKSIAIAATGKHIYADLTYIDEQYHGKVCTQCGNADKSKHKSDSEWTYDGKNHWNCCKDCGYQINIALHDYENGCGSACKTCSYHSPFAHETSEDYTSDETMHHKICNLCNLAVESEMHAYTSDCDETCNVCQAIRKTTTAHTDTVRSDGQCHWIACAVCDQEQEHITHIPDETAKDWEDQCCTQCNHILRPADQHVHTYESIEYDRRAHWGTCACGAQIPEEGHRFSMETGKCSICHATSTPIGAQYDYDWVWLVVIAAFAGIVVILLLILLIRRLSRKRI